VENVAALLDRGMGDVLGNLADLGFAAEWSVLSACAFGAPHTRERVFILAYAEGERFLERGRLECCPCVQTTGDVHYWTREPMPARVADGVPCRMDRLKGLGNAVVPQVAELVGRRVVALLRAQDEEQQP
jgi:DNA (cytosine-5)-methyltransferase 1